MIHTCYALIKGEIFAVQQNKPFVGAYWDFRLTYPMPSVLEFDSKEPRVKGEIIKLPLRRFIGGKGLEYKIACEDEDLRRLYMYMNLFLQIKG